MASYTTKKFPDDEYIKLFFTDTLLEIIPSQEEVYFCDDSRKEISRSLITSNGKYLNIDGKQYALENTNDIQAVNKIYFGDIVDGEGVKSAFKKASNKLLEIGKSISECVGLYLPEAYNKFFTKEGQKEIYQNINNNIVKIRLYEEKIKDDINNKNYNEAALSFGQILSIVLDSNIIQI